MLGRQVCWSTCNNTAGRQKQGILFYLASQTRWYTVQQVQHVTLPHSTMWGTVEKDSLLQSQVSTWMHMHVHVCAHALEHIHTPYSKQLYTYKNNHFKNCVYNILQKIYKDNLVSQPKVIICAVIPAFCAIHPRARMDGALKCEFALSSQ